MKINIEFEREIGHKNTFAYPALGLHTADVLGSHNYNIMTFVVLCNYYSFFTGGRPCLFFSKASVCFDV